MKVLVVSDTHARTEQLRMLQEKFAAEDIMKIHCGDSELLPDSPYLSGFIVVQGNCDVYRTFQDEVVVEVEGLKILVAHGHQYGVKQSLMSISYRAKELGASIVCFGHSHFLGIEESNGVLYVNPGSLNLPRGRVEGSYVIMDIGLDKIIVSAFSDQNESIYYEVYSR